MYGTNFKSFWNHLGIPNRGHSSNQPKDGRNSLNVTPRHILLTIFLSFYYKEFRNLFKELNLLYFVEHFA